MAATVTYTCEWCGKERTVLAWYFRQLYPEGTDKPLSCCQRCGAIMREGGRQVIVTCPNCGKRNSRKPTHARRLFCDKQCYYEHRRKYPELYPPRPPLSSAAMARLKARTGPRNPMYGRCGPLNPNWTGGKIRTRGKGWYTIRTLIRRRDGERCLLCGETEKLVVHHIVLWRAIPCNHPHNLITLCRKCHQVKAHGTRRVSRRQLLDLALESTRTWSSLDDHQLVLQLDRQQRSGKPIPARLAETLSLLASAPARKPQPSQLPLPLSVG